MKNNFITSLAVVLLLAVVCSSCGRTVYRRKVYNSSKYINHKERYHFWHSHGARPRQHYGGYW